LLSPDQVSRLQRDIQILVAEQRWVGCQGLKISDEIKVTIAAQAALLLLGNEGYYFERVPSILVYPRSFLRRRSRNSGLMEEDEELQGEAHTRGSIVLSWQDCLTGGQDPSDGQNLVLHEFAHHLDALDGDAGGSPPFGNQESSSRWNQEATLGHERLLRQLERGQPTVLDPYATESPAEFFAVATESFFERPGALAHDMPAVFELLSEFYRVDPRPWFADGSVAQLQLRELSVPLMEHIRDESPTVSLAPPLHSADAYFARGLDAYLQENFKAALWDFHETLLREPDDAEALRYLAETEFELGDLNAAEADALRSVELDSTDCEAQQTLAMILVEKQKFEEAYALLEGLVRDDPYDGNRRYLRGVTLAGLGEYMPAIDDFSAVIQRDLAHAEAWFQRGECYALLGFEHEARRDHKQAHKLDPETK